MKEKSIQILNSAKVFFSYIVCLVISTIYTLFADGTSGILLLSFMILVPLISFISMIISKNSIDIEIKSNDNTLNKNSPIDIVLKFTKKTILPIPFINVTLGYSPHLCNKDTYSIKDFPQLRTSMAFEKSLDCTYSFTSKVSGKSSVYIQEAYMYDYLGFFRIRLKNVFSSIDVYITPEVKEIQSSQTLFNNICNSVISNDEEEDIKQPDIYSIGSTLGYLHREYVQGDSPKKINWKLSYKKNKLMVRLDEPSPQSKPCMILDMSISTDNSNRLSSITNFEKLVESSLSLASMCVRNGIECEYILCNCGISKSFILTSNDDVYNLAVTISHNTEDGEHKLPDEISKLKSSECMYLLFTDVYEGNLKSEINSLKNRGILMESILSPRYYGRYSSPNVWIVNKDLSISQSGY